MKPSKRSIYILISLALASVLVFWIWSYQVTGNLLKNYDELESAAVTARDGSVIFLITNAKGNYRQAAGEIPQKIKDLLIRKEDRYFYWHMGINPASVISDFLSQAGFGQRNGASTITQQLSKILLGQENRRTFGNKVRETFYSLALEFSQSKDLILSEYADSIYMGNRVQGLKTAAAAYFNADVASLSDKQIFQILAAISDPVNLNPARQGNIEKAKLLAKNMGANPEGDFTSAAEATANLTAYYQRNIILFELSSYIVSDSCSQNRQTTLDRNINEKVRQIIAQNIEELNTKKAKNAAAIVVSLPENEVLAMIGSPDPQSNRNGYRIDMLSVPRQIGSTIKPFIYLKAFEKGMRPYTLIDDREYKYPAGEDFSIYPENYDRTYRGPISAHYALANSINTAAVITLGYAGIDEFGQFIQDDLQIATQQKYQNYQMGVALGALETDLTTLAQAYSIFPNSGKLKNLKLFNEPSCNKVFRPEIDRQTAKPAYIQLINKILSDRIVAQDQFSSASDLNLDATNYALKTGTSHDYTDSWVVGYTPDFLVAVWVGNADASAMEGISGQLGAGRIWNGIMQMMLSSSYNKKTSFDFSQVIEYENGNNIEYGLQNDDYQTAQKLIDTADTHLIQKPHDGDIYMLEDNTRVVLRAKSISDWTINGQYIGNGQELVYAPDNAGTYTIEARSGSVTETVKVIFVAN